MLFSTFVCLYVSFLVNAYFLVSISHAYNTKVFFVVSWLPVPEVQQLAGPVATIVNITDCNMVITLLKYR